MAEVKISEVLLLLDKGFNRKEINEKLGINPKEAKVLWSHPKLKGQKVSKYKIEILIEDDTEETNN